LALDLGLRPPLKIEELLRLLDLVESIIDVPPLIAGCLQQPDDIIERFVPPLGGRGVAIEILLIIVTRAEGLELIDGEVRDVIDTLGELLGRELIIGWVGWDGHHD